MAVETWAKNLRKKLNLDLCNTQMGYKYEQMVELGTNFTKENPTPIQTVMVDYNVIQIMKNSYDITNLEDLNGLADQDLLIFFTSSASARLAIQNFLSGQDDEE